MVCGLFIHMKVEAHCGASLLGFVSDHCVVMILQVPLEALEFAGMSINFRSSKFGYSICPIFSKGHAEIFPMRFSMNLLKIGHMGYLRLMHGPGYLST